MTDEKTWQALGMVDLKDKAWQLIQYLDRPGSLTGEIGSVSDIDGSRPGDVVRNLLHAIDGALPIPMRLPCPECGRLHVDEGEFASKPHHTHACQHCGMVWRPAVVPTVGVQFLPGFKNP